MLLALIVLLFFSKECPFEMCILCDNVEDTIFLLLYLFFSGKYKAFCVIVPASSYYLSGALGG